MKTIFRVAILGLVIAAFGAAASVFAQTPCTAEKEQELYGIWNKNKKSDNPVEIRLAVKAGEEFVKNCDPNSQKAVYEHLQKNIPIQKERADKLELIDRFNNSVKDRKTYNADEAYSSGKALIAKDPTLAFDIGIVLTLVGFENSIKTPPVDKYNSETISFAKKTISDIEGGKTSNLYGAWVFTTAVLDAQKKTDPAKSKQKTLAFMNYVIGSIMYFNQKAEKDALPFFYKAAQIDSDVKNRPDIYQAIGGWYLSEILKMETKRQELLTANKNEDNPETLALLASMKGYADRGINALGKAYKLATSPQQADYKKGLYTKLQSLYELRFGKTEGLDVHLVSVSTQPLVDPTTPVTPIVEAPPTTTTSTTTPATKTTGDTTKPATTTPVNTKPATTNPTTTPATTTPTKPAAKATGGKVNTTKSKATVNKKKGTK